MYSGKFTDKETELLTQTFKISNLLAEYPNKTSDDKFVFAIDLYNILGELPSFLKAVEEMLNDKVDERESLRETVKTTDEFEIDSKIDEKLNPILDAMLENQKSLIRIVELLTRK